MRGGGGWQLRPRGGRAASGEQAERDRGQAASPLCRGGQARAGALPGVPACRAGDSSAGQPEPERDEGHGHLHRGALARGGGHEEGGDAGDQAGGGVLQQAVGAPPGGAGGAGGGGRCGPVGAEARARETARQKETSCGQLPRARPDRPRAPQRQPPARRRRLYKAQGCGRARRGAQPVWSDHQPRPSQRSQRSCQRAGSCGEDHPAHQSVLWARFRAAPEAAAPRADLRARCARLRPPTSGARLWSDYAQRGPLLGQPAPAGGWPRHAGGAGGAGRGVWRGHPARAPPVRRVHPGGGGVGHGQGSWRGEGARRLPRDVRAGAVQRPALPHGQTRPRARGGPRF
mmetsp:Transcript_4309/g.7964  ORF Transcript_4309/g.7964 Transcript_4309/m.7964 type:complete len:344 (+) Transcript_4309:1132-2163(+)